MHVKHEIYETDGTTRVAVSLPDTQAHETHGFATVSLPRFHYTQCGCGDVLQDFGLGLTRVIEPSEDPDEPDERPDDVVEKVVLAALAERRRAAQEWAAQELRRAVEQIVADPSVSVEDIHTYHWDDDRGVDVDTDAPHARISTYNSLGAIEPWQEEPEWIEVDPGDLDLSSRQREALGTWLSRAAHSRG